MKNTSTLKYLIASSFFLLALIISTDAIAQEKQTQKMEALNFMIGDWVGTSRIYKNGKLDKEVPAYQKISYDLDQGILVIELHSSLLQLHTIVHFSEKDNTYYYQAFTKNGAKKLTAAYTDGQFIVSASDTRKYIFSKVGNNQFQERGEELIDGQWVRFFEDNFEEH